MKLNDLQIVGYDNEKKEIAKLKNYVINVDDYRVMGVKVPGGLVVYGPSGLGKTLLVNSLSCDEIRTYEITEADVLSDDENRIRTVFEEAKRNAPSIILLDDLDKVLQATSKLLFNRRDEVKRIIKSEISGLMNNDGVLAVVTCNTLNSVKDIVVETGRFDRIIDLHYPDSNHREKLIKHYFDNSQVGINVDIETVSNMMEGFSIRDIESVVNESILIAVTDKKNNVDIEDVETAVKNRGFFFDLSDRFNDPEEKYKVAVHEAGHILITMLLKKKGIKVASVVPSEGNIGYIQLHDNEEILTTEDIEDLIAVSLAGRVAEREIIGNISVGASSDLEKAVIHARKLIVNHVGYGYDCVAAITDMEISYELMYEIEKNIAKLLSEQDVRVKNLITQHKEVVLKMAEMLKEKNVLDHQEILRIFKESHINIGL